jgi:hypothetical protein
VNNPRRTNSAHEPVEAPFPAPSPAPTVEFGIPSYNEGPGIVATLESVYQAARACGIERIRIFLSDSSATAATVDAARAWASGAGCELVVNRSDRRRSAKEALNTIFDMAGADVLVLANADVTVPPQSLATLLRDLTEPPCPHVAIGISLPDPTYRSLRHRAAIWQMRLMHRVASRRPRDLMRADGVFWGAWRDFYGTFRYPLHQGSLADDVEAKRYVLEHRLPARNSWQAVVQKVPAATLADFISQTTRGQAASGQFHPRRTRLQAALIQAAADPFGALLYLTARVLGRAGYGRRQHGEYWEVASSTKRGRPETGAPDRGARP